MMNYTLFKQMPLALLFLLLSLSTGLCQSLEFSSILNINKVRNSLVNAPDAFTGQEKISSLTIALPDENGDLKSYYVIESSIMSEEFASAFPSIKTYAIKSVENPLIQGRFTLSDFGLNAYIPTPKGILGIRPTDLLNPTEHISYLGDAPANLASLLVEEEFCGMNNDDMVQQSPAPNVPQQKNSTTSNNSTSSFMPINGSTTRTYDFAAVATGEFTAGNGGTVASATAVIVNTINASQVIYDKDFAIRFNLLMPQIYLDENTDPFIPDEAGGCSRTSQATNAVNLTFPIGNYDIGHVFHQTSANDDWRGGGVATLGVVCEDFIGGSCDVDNDPSTPNVPDTGPFKARGWSGSGNNTTNGWVRLFSHEVGHQFSAPHTFNGEGSSCTAGNISSTTSYEIASGTTIMSYRGICQADNNVPSAGSLDNYFHAHSMESIINYINSEACEDGVVNGNTPPVITADDCGLANYSIPISTPFRLTGSGVDADGDQIMYNWEQYDEDGLGTPTQGFFGAIAAASPIAPLFRSLPPTASPTRNFPSLNLIAAGDYASDFEPLPTVARTLNFRLTGRDCNPVGGGTDHSSLAITVDNTDGAFAVNAPNGGENLAAGSNTTVTWTTSSLTNNVTIRLSTDGGISYPTVLAMNTADDGSESVFLPGSIQNTSMARILVESADNPCVVFFDVSNTDFTISSSCTPVTNSLCSANDVSTEVGNAAANLTLTNIVGNPVISKNFNVQVGDPTMNVVVANSTNNCQNQNFSKIFGQMEFSVSQTGDYNFSEQVTGFLIMNVFENAFDPNDPCPTWVDSNGTDQDDSPGGFANASSSFTLSLTECTTYFFTISGYGSVNDFNGNVNMSGPGDIVEVSTSATDYSYTYIAVNNANNQVVAIDAGADFTSLAAGTYTVSGMSYYSGAGPNPQSIDLNTFIGQTTNDLLAAGNCLLLSSNNLTLNLSDSCPDLSAAPANVTITNSSCMSVCTVMGGSISAPANACPTGSTLQYSVDGGTTFNATLPTYNQTGPAQSIQTRCSMDSRYHR